MTTRLHERYRSAVRPALMQEFGYKLLDDGRKVRVARRSGEVIDK